ncbi:lipid II flippase MurJ [Paenibacillus sp. HJGM_3]|uniref:lipid II flippase MurJ n=1 Tax=Paenibacillus sp. HJGM_3 TaxID=3379816 RepID=UPI00385F0E48
MLNRIFNRSNTYWVAGYYTLFNLSSKAFGLFRNWFIAFLFGVSVYTDAFWAALLPIMFFKMTFGTALTNVIVPVYLENTKKQKQSILTYLSTNLLFTFFLICIIVINSKVILKIFTPGISDEVLGISQHYIIMLSPLISILALIDLCMSLLAANGEYFKSAVLNFLISLSLVLFMFVFYFDKAVLLPLSTLLANALVAGIGVIWLKAKLYIARIDLKMSKTIFVLAIPVMISSGIENISHFIDKFLASFLETGSLTLLSYSLVLQEVILAGLVGPVVSIYFPKISKMIIQSENISRLSIKTNFYLNLIISVILLIFTYIGFPVVKLVFIRLEENQIKIIFSLAILLIFNVGWIAGKLILSKIYYCHYNTSILSAINIIGLITNAILGYLFVNYYGLNGIVYATIISTIVSTAIYTMIAIKKNYISAAIIYSFIPLIVVGAILFLFSSLF